MLTAIVGNLFLAGKEAKAINNEKLKKYLTITDSAITRARELTTQLLTFSRGGTPILEDCSIEKLIRESVKFIMSGSNTIYKFKISANLWHAQVDAGQINQVLNNLVINAIQAMENNGKINIIAENHIIPHDTTIPLKSGKYIKITIQDFGKGISEDIIKNIFDPYYTTKKSGSGLGLATARSIILKHNGYIGVTSTLHKGTDFYFYLPAAANKAKQRKLKVPALKQQAVSKILLMDDDRMICEAISDILKDAGFACETAFEGNSAIEKYTKAWKLKKPFDLVILDLTVPGGIGGLETLQELQKINPEVKAIASSGYSNSPVMSNFTHYGFSGILPKPFSMDNLLQIAHKCAVKN